MLKKIDASIDFKENLLKYSGGQEKIFDGESSINNSEKASETVAIKIRNKAKCLGKLPGHAVVIKSDKFEKLGYNPIVEKFDCMTSTNQLQKMKINSEFSTSEKTQTSCSNKSSLRTTNISSSSYSDKNSERLKFRNEIKTVISESHSKIDTTLPFRTDVLAEIRTVSTGPLWSRQYPYPFSVNAFVNEEINRMLENGVIRPSNSPYNSPIWVVPKKGTNSDGTPKFRLVIDFKKVNEDTIPDRYPIPDTNIILSNLGKSKYFSSIDLESGFHQILMHPDDIEKTAFSINNGKYEFLRMPFGLKNAPRIFQRAMDDILRPYVGKICHVYMDDIIVFSETLDQHSKDLKTIMDTLGKAHMKISLEKSKFFKKETEFLGYMVAHKTIRTDRRKIDTIVNYPTPTNLRELRSFLGLANYYRKFVQNFAQIAKPLTVLTSGENGKVSKNMSKKTPIEMGDEEITSFQNLKHELTLQVELTQPDYNKKFILNTDASNIAVGAVLSQDSKPITFISKTLNKTERNYATNEKELYAIVWSLKTLRNYLYGVTNLEIHTDHQPLSFALSNRNPNSKMKRWHAFIEEFSPKIIYKPGSSNLVADALSRIEIHNMTDESMSEDEDDFETQHSAQSTDTFFIEETKKPLNQFKQQLLLMKNRFTIHERVCNFGKTRHIIEYDTVENLLTILREFLRPNIVTGIYCTAEDLYEIKRPLKETFNNKFLHTKLFPMDIVNMEDQCIIIEETHNRAHRNFDENIKQIESLYYWPEMRKKMKEYVRNCTICSKNKYDRNPQKIPIRSAPIPTKEGEQLHIDIFYAQHLKFITCVDAYSKFLVLKHIENKLNLGEKVLEILQSFPDTKIMTLDNEPSLSTPQFKSLMDRMNIQLYYCDPHHSTTNGQVERVHSTIIEIGRCIREEYNIIDTLEIMLRAVQQYNLTIHSVTKYRPYDVFYNKITHEDVTDRLRTAQERMLQTHNKNRKNREFIPGQVIYEKKVGERNKLQPRYKKQEIKEDLGNKVIISNRDRIVHKDNIKT